MTQQTVKLTFTASTISGWQWANWKTATAVSSLASYHYSVLVAGDVDGDNDVDLVGCVFSDGYGPISRHNGAASSKRTPPNSLPNHVGACNLMLNNGAGAFTRKTGGIWGSTGEMAVDDVPAFLVDLDGDSDLVSPAPSTPW